MMDDKLQGGMKCFWRAVAAYRENNSSGGIADQYFAAADEIKRLTAEVSVLRESVEDFISQIDDCRSAHTVCGQFTSLAAAIKKNIAAVLGSQEKTCLTCGHKWTENTVWCAKCHTPKASCLWCEVPVDDKHKPGCPTLPPVEKGQ